jgi:general secretion pathway protein B
MTPRQTEKQTVGTSRAVQPESKPVPPVVASPAIVTSGPPLLKVQGIAFQDGSATGVAVVNGIAVSKGSVIEGVRVEEIQNDRVMFSRDGKKFEIILDKSN